MRVHSVKKAQRDYPQYKIKKGEPYYWWKFRYGGRVVSKTYPKRSQLTRSSYLGQLYDLQDRIGDFSASDASEVKDFVEGLILDIESLRDEQESSRSSMPEQLQEVGSGELLGERISTLESAISELEDIDTDYEEPDEDEMKSDALDNFGHEDVGYDDLTDEQKAEVDAYIETEKEEKLQEWIDEKVSDIQNVTLD